MAEPREEYLLYVRVPDPEDQSRDDTIAFLERIAELLTDDAANIYVEPYAKHVEHDEDVKVTEGTHGSESGIKEEGREHFDNSPDSTKKNSLQPLYFCHNKF